MNTFSFSIPQNIEVGRGSLAKLPDAAKQLGGKHGLIISGPHIHKIGLADRAVHMLICAGIEADVFYEVEANPSVETVNRAMQAFRDCGADFLVAFGGGSPMDVAKAVAILAKYGGSIVDYEGGGKVPGPVIPMIAIPTTAGTGSEVTPFSVITDHERNYKLSVFSYEILPKYAIADADLIMTVPASTAAACGMDAFIHAEEAYVSKAASPFTDMMAEKAMELIGANIRRYVADRSDAEAAEAMMLGSLFAGIAFAFARLGNVHAMSHPVSAYFNVPHGVANAVLLPEIVAYNAMADHGKYRVIYNSISRIKACDEEFDPLMLVRAIRRLNEELGIPGSLTEAVRTVKKVSAEEAEKQICDTIPAMAADAMKSGNIQVNPRSSRQEDLERLYRQAL